MITFRSAVPADYESVREFLMAAGWQHRVSDAAQFRLLMENTSRTVIAFEGARIVGFARALCDEVSNGYISMVAVTEERRGHGVGRELVRRLTKDNPEITWVLRAGRDSSGFWERLGFEYSEVAMEKVRS